MLKLASNAGSVSQIEPFVNKLVRRYNLTAERQCDILISLTEAVTNAIVHGNCKAENKTVTLKPLRSDLQSGREAQETIPVSELVNCLCASIAFSKALRAKSVP